MAYFSIWSVLKATAHTYRTQSASLALTTVSLLAAFSSFLGFCYLTIGLFPRNYQAQELPIAIGLRMCLEKAGIVLADVSSLGLLLACFYILCFGIFLVTALITSIVVALLAARNKVISFTTVSTQVRRHFWHMFAGLFIYGLVGLAFTMIMSIYTSGYQAVHKLFSPTQDAVFTTIGAVLLMLYIVWMQRFSLMVFCTVDTGDHPLDALKHSWRLTRGSFIRMIMLSISFAVLVDGGGQLLYFLLAKYGFIPAWVLQQQYVLNTLFRSFVSLPLFFLMNAHLYLQLKSVKSVQ